MLTEIQVRNYAVIEECVLELSAGMTALSGETGAGKSILVGALGLVLGDRADAAVVRDGTERTEISAHFDAGPNVLQWLRNETLDAEDECLVRRIVSREGRSRAWVNGHAVTLQTLRTLGTQLVDIHGQHLHQSLVRKPIQRGILDAAGQCSKLVAAVAAAFENWHNANNELTALEQAQADRDARLDLLRFQIQELEGLGLADDEIGELQSEQNRLAHAGKLAEGTQQALAMLSGDDDDNAQTLLGRAAHLLSGLASIDTRLSGIAELLTAAEIQVGEAAAQLSDYNDGLNMDPGRRDYVEERLATAQTLARKHRIEPALLPQQLQKLSAELAQLDHAEQHLEQLRNAVATTLKRYDLDALALHKARRKAATKLDKAITTTIRELGMADGQFKTQVEFDVNQRTAHGGDDIEFLVSANVGQTPRPLSRVASGGELSRISLAIEVLAASDQSVPTMVFDEIDTGVGGGIAEMIGQKMRTLAADTQVLCVTHLPQVASQAHHHVQVSKHSDGKTTQTRLHTLNDSERVAEVARMLGGVKITEATRRHASEMIRNAANDPSPRRRQRR